MAEFSLIERFCQKIGKQHNSTRLSVGDDAAVLTIPDDMELAVSVDTMVEGVHFYADTEPALIAHKLLAVNLSDMAAMGAKPKWATLALTLPDDNQQWLTEFSESLDAIAKQHKVQLVGGDTTQGNLTLSLNIMGLLTKGKALTRSGSRVDDDVYVSNTLGDAALALSCIESGVNDKRLSLEQLRKALDLPEPQVDLGLGLLNIANACIDVSDGLVADLGHIAKQSKVSIEVDVDAIPISSQYKQHLQFGGSMDLALTGGDDYQLAFTAVTERRGELKQLSKELNIPLTRIGKVQAAVAQSVILKQQDGKPYTINQDAGYQHFND